VPPVGFSAAAEIELSEPARREFRNILIIKPSSIGDVVHALPIAAALRRRHPSARISWLVRAGCLDIVSGHPALDEVILFPLEAPRGPLETLRVPGTLLSFVEELRARKFDLALDLQGLLRSGLAAWACGASVRVGLSTAREMSWLFYTHVVPVGSMETHAVDRLWQAARFLGCTGRPDDFTMTVPPAAQIGVERALREAGLAAGEPYAVMVVGAQWPTKVWLDDRFARTAAEVRRRHGLRSVLVAVKADVERAARIAAGSDGAAVSLAGRTTLKQVLALIRGCDLVVTNDSGPMHIAAAMGKPLAAMFGPTNPVRTGPFARPGSVVRAGVPCSPCYRRACPTQHECMTELTTEMVMATVGRELAGGARTAV
jgi:lipopolysaccharide heptosyltransferase I